MRSFVACTLLQVKLERSRRMRARMGEKRNAYRILVGKPEVRDHWEDLDVGGWTILKLILKR
jgi:hypothetical protein